MNSWNNIEEMAKLKEEMAKSNAKFTSLIPQIRDVRDMPLLADKLKAKYEKLVVYAVLLYNYAPCSIIGENIPKMKRRLMAKAMKCSNGYLSRKKSVVLFLYQNDKAFHKKVEEAMEYCSCL